MQYAQVKKDHCGCLDLANFGSVKDWFGINFSDTCIHECSINIRELSGRVLRGFKPHWHNCIMVLEPNTFILA